MPKTAQYNLALAYANGEGLPHDLVQAYMWSSIAAALGARVPIMLTSRADGTLSRLASCALAQLFIHHSNERPK
jgi:TPR repeat protein